MAGQLFDGGWFLFILIQQFSLVNDASMSSVHRPHTHSIYYHGVSILGGHSMHLIYVLFYTSNGPG